MRSPVLLFFLIFLPFRKKRSANLDLRGKAWYKKRESEKYLLEDNKMEHIVTLKTRNLCDSAANGGCGECQTSCQSACTTSCGIANQKCENTED